MILEQHQTGGLDLLGQMWSWVSVEAAQGATLIAPWSRPIACYGNYDRIATCGGMQPVVATGTSERIEVEG